MKKYNRSEEKRNSLTSVNKYTTLDFNEDDGKHPRISNGSNSKRRASDCCREDDGSRWNKPRRSGKKDRRNKVQHQQDYASKVSCQCRFPAEDGREYRPECRDEGQKSEDLNETIAATFTLLSEL